VTTNLNNNNNNMRKFTHKPLIEIIALGVATMFGFMIIGGLTTVIIEVITNGAPNINLI